MRNLFQDAIGAAIVACVVPLLACKALSKREEAASTEKSKSGERATESADAPVVSVSIGEEAALGGVKMWVKEVRDCVYEHESNRNNLKQQGKRLVGALVYFEGTYADGSVSFNASSFKGYDGEGITYSVSSPHGTDCDPTLRSAQVAKGDKKKGWVAFTIPDSTKTLTVKHTHRPPRKVASVEKQVISIKAF